MKILVLTSCLQEISRFHEKEKANQDNTGIRGFRGRKTMTFLKPSVEKIGEAFYLIADEVFLISGNPRKLSSQEVEDLPVIISWRGDKCSFETDEKECIELLASIISDMNSMQDDFISFPLGMYISCLYANETNNYGISYSEGQSHQISCMLAGRSR